MGKRFGPICHFQHQGCQTLVLDANPGPGSDTPVQNKSENVLDFCLRSWMIFSLLYVKSLNGHLQIIIFRKAN